MHIVFINYTHSGECRDPEAWFRKIAAHLPLLEALAEDVKVSYVTRIGWEGTAAFGNVQFYFTKYNRTEHFIPRTLHRQVKWLLPDKVIVAGLHYPLQVLQLRWMIGHTCKIFARHHADKPFSGSKKWLQQRADRVIDRYLFTSAGNAEEWLDQGIISNKRKLVELPATAPSFRRMNKATAREKTGISGDPVFLWAGRLEVNKDPITVVRAFCSFAQEQPEASLLMIFQTDELKSQIDELCAAHPHARVILKGRVDHSEMHWWYSAADFFVSGSHREGGSYALLEAMACGCIPIVTDIAPALKVTAGKGFSYQPGDVTALLQCMRQAAAAPIGDESDLTEKHFLENYTAEKLALTLAAL